ncbi:MAG TPA: shikimate dehydrogenase [Blastocatellia bacterium]|nr:shikimate dehydrogenase [Blastocatellia bacterium]
MRENVARVCAVITEATVEAARAAISQAESCADLFELRLDYLRDFSFADVERLRPILENRSIPAIITCRAQSEGGQQHIEDSVRLRLLIEGARRYADYCDIEAAYYQEAARLSPDPSRLIVSYHDFTGTPGNLNPIYDRLTVLPAAVHKIVTQASSITDSLSIFALLARAASQGRSFISMAMGEAGVITRILGPAFGSFLTYGTLATGKESAAGQPSCDELKSLYRVHQITQRTAITGIVGRPVAHSASPAMHNAAFAQLGLDFVYLPFEVDDIGEFFARLVSPSTRELNWNLKGFSITIPHKTSALPLLDELNKTAQRIGAVNTVVLSSGRLYGHNTDVRGAMKPLEKITSLEGERCSVIGAGGAARAVVYGLLERRAEVKVFARNPEKAKRTMESFGVEVFSIESLVPTKARILINTTPVGLRGHSEDASPVRKEALKNCGIVYDLVYNPRQTKLMIDALEAGCQTLSGLDMLVAQAALQFELWTGQKAPIECMRKAALSKINAQAL